MLTNQLHPVLAESSFDGWVKILFFILIFGGSALGTILKKIIAHFTPNEEENTPAQPQSSRPDIRRRAPSAPVARPLNAPRPDARREKVSPMRPLSETLAPLRPVAGFPKPEKPVRPARPAPATVRPPTPSKQTRSRRRPVQEQPSASVQQQSPPPQKPKDQHEHGLLVDLHEDGEQLVDELAQSEKKISPRDRLLGSRDGLRDAMILSEVLSPPLAMRDDSNTFGS